MNVKYRADIDGLRAVAVLSVLVYHAKLAINGQPLLSGGYLGVDIFFVISGYLITKIIYGEIHNGKFSIVNFYFRRARRILPALLVMMLVTAPLALLYLLPADFLEYSQSILSTLLFSSNIFFWFEVDYFSSPNDVKPLIHTWSLAVEEQFYLFFPVLLILLKSISPAKLEKILIVVFLISLSLAHISSIHYPDASFYLLPTRGWELFAGSLLAVREAYKPNNFKLNQTTASVAFFMVMIPMALFSNETHHPSLLTLIPIMGACLLIANKSTGNWVYRLLSSKPFVLVGLISYSLYLWHQPILAFGREYVGRTLGLSEQLLAIAFSFGAAYVSWRIIETPFRSLSTISNKLLIGILFAAVIILTGFATTGIFTNGFASRFSESDFIKLVKITKDKESRKLVQDGKNCFGRLPSDACSFGEKAAKIKMMLIGDSHAGSLAPSLADAALKNNWYLATSMTSSCPYIPGFAVATLPDCDRVANTERAEILKTDEFNTVIIHSRLQIYVEGERYDNLEGGKESGAKAPVVYLNDQTISNDERLSLLQQQLEKMVSGLLLSGKNVILIYPVPEVGWSVPRMLRANLPKDFQERLAWLNESGINTSHVLFKKRNKKTYSILDSIGLHPNLTRIYPEKIFCDTYVKERCATHSLQDVFYEDDDHLSRAGADLVIKEVMDAVKSVGSTPKREAGSI
jgi:peptidoglycan/LPS O-acetylase OafA/YrhL